MIGGSMTRRLVAIVAADVAGYSRMTAYDEEGTLAALRSHRTELIDPTIAGHGGRIANTAGDSILMEFPSVVDATRCCIDIQRGLAERNASIPEEKRIMFRIGINLGDIVEQDGDLLGDGVNVAARLEGLAEPGGICLSRAARDQIRDRLAIALDEIGEVEVKNIPRPIHVWRWTGDNTRSEHDAVLPKPLQQPDKPSIAVLPFINMSGDPEQEYFSDGIAEDVTTSLSKLPQLFVIARNSSFTYKGKARKAQEISDELGVRYVVEGSVRKAGNRVRISAQLIDCSTGGHLWADRFDRELTDIFVIQDEVTQEIVTAMALKLSTDDQHTVTHRITDNLEAYDYYLFLDEAMKSDSFGQSFFFPSYSLSSHYSILPLVP
jgi:adenylate cyclase